MSLQPNRDLHEELVKILRYRAEDDRYEQRMNRWRERAREMVRNGEPVPKIDKEMFRD